MYKLLVVLCLFVAIMVFYAVGADTANPIVDRQDATESGGGNEAGAQQPVGGADQHCVAKAGRESTAVQEKSEGLRKGMQLAMRIYKECKGRLE